MTRPPSIGSAAERTKPACAIPFARTCSGFGEAADALDQVAIAVLVIRDGLADARNDVLRIMLRRARRKPGQSLVENSMQ
jgi:hypothetical protein